MWRYSSGFFKICVSVEAGTVVGEEFSSLLGGYTAVFHCLGYPCFHVAYQFLGIVLYVVQYLCDGFAINDAVYLIMILVSPNRLCISPSISW